MKHVIISKMGEQIVFMESWTGDAYHAGWTPNLSKAMLFDEGEESSRNGPVIACWSGGIPAGTVGVDVSVAIIDADKLKAWQEWDMPVPNYWDSDSGCKRMVISGPKYD